MTHRSDRIMLSQAEPCCEPQACTIKHRCARYLAILPRFGSIMDYSKQEKKPAQAVKQWVGP